MDKSRSEILSEIKEALESLKAQVSDIEARIAAIEAEPEEVEAEEVKVEEVGAEQVETAEIETPELEAEKTEAPVPETEVSADLPESVDDAGPIDISLEDDIDSMGLGDIPSEEKKEPAVALEDVFAAAAKENINDKQEKKSKKAVMDVMGNKCAWKTAIPGTPVKNIISAISLNDRVLFINSLFKENAMAFQDAIATFNAMSSFAEAEEYIQQNYPDWNLNSDMVYRLMMAIRRKLK